MKLPAIFLCSLLFLPQAQAYCFNYAASKYNQNPLVVESIAIWESSLRPDAVGRNYDKAGRLLSSDYCLMQSIRRTSGRWYRWVSFLLLTIC